MIQKLILILVVFILSNNLLYSQIQLSDSYNFSLHGGIFHTAQDDFDKTYDSNIGFVYGVGFGIPVSTKSYFYGKATYFSKDGVPLKKTYDFVDDKLVLVSEIKEGTAEFSQWVINGGYQHNFPLSVDYILGINGGITYTTISEELKDNHK